MAGHSHEHPHEQTHDHSHDGESYYLDQLCMVGLSGAFGIIGLALYTWRSDMLTLLLGPQFHPFVLASGIALLVVAAVRAGCLWVQSGQVTPAHLHDDCGDGCGHAHHDHNHDHDHTHDHAHHDHGHDDHDHGWAPWRYVVLLLPILLFLLGLPNKLPSIAKADTKVDMTREAMNYGALVAVGPSLGQSALACQLLGGSSVENASPINYKDLENIASSAKRRADWKNTAVEVRGQFSGGSANDRVFNLVRFKIACCANDSIQLNVPMVCRDPVQGFHTGEWVKVVGTVDFIEQKGSYRTLVRIPSLGDIKKTPPDLNPYVQ